MLPNRRVIFSIVILSELAIVIYGCLCLPSLPSLPSCPPPLPPIPCPPCPPPPMCPPSFCPPPPVCPICPPQPPPCPLPTPCLPSPSPCGGLGLGAPPPVPYQPAPIVNDCCCSCGSPCRYMHRAKTHGAKIFAASSLEIEDDPQCNSEKLRAIIEDNITDDASISKRAIQKVAEEKMASHINVICAKSDFSYVAYTDTYCQASIGDVTCYAFKPM